MSEFSKRYLNLLEEDRKLTKQMVEDGDLSEEEGMLRNEIRKEEILELMPADSFKDEKLF